ncbi:diguanylate cyclase [Clostridium sp.]|uniref:diguanylate cyclase n=1 Tax=Clostridium sp. TaxID=1506 RepID=UPI002FC94097
MENKTEKQNLGTLLRKRYKLALLIIASLVILSQIILQISISREKNYSTVINIAGRQRMLSQRITKSALSLYSLEDKNLIAESLQELIEATTLWEKSHFELLHRDQNMNLSGVNSEIVLNLFEEIEVSRKKILISSNRIIDSVQEDIFSKETLYSSLQTIDENEDIFLRGMDSIVYRYELESMNKIHIIKSYGFIILFVTLFVLLLETLFIFIPAEKEITVAFEKIHESHENLLKLFETAPAPMFLIDEESLNVMEFNELAEKMVGITNHIPQSLTLDNFLKDSPENRNIIGKIKNSPKLFNEEAILHTSVSDDLIALISSSKMNFYDKATILLGLSDITKLKKAEEILKRYATVDEMTGLLNKRSGMLILENLFEKSKTDSYNISLCFIDIDGLKAVNDTYGHEEGDWYIKTISKIIIANMRSEDCVFRYGGDEIIVIFGGCDSLKATTVLNRIQESLRLIEKEYNKPYKISFSYGIVDTNSTNAAIVENFISEADVLMYKNKKEKGVLRQ